MAERLLNAQDNDGRTALHRQQPSTLVRRLVASSADPNIRDRAGRTALHYCVELPALACLLAAGAEVNAQDKDGQTALMTHLQADRLGMAAVLLAHDANPELANASGATAIFFARSVAAMQLLLQDYQVNPLIQSSSGRNALHGCQLPECVDLLCHRGVTAGDPDAEGCTPLHLSRSAGVARTLIFHGAPVDARDGAGRTPLHHAVRRADHNVVVELLSQKADPNATDAEGNTPLHLVRTPAIARRLLEAGADPHKSNAVGLVAAERVEPLIRD